MNPSPPQIPYILGCRSKLAGCEFLGTDSPNGSGGGEFLGTNGSGGVRFFQVLTCPTHGGCVFSSATGLEGFRICLSTGSPNGSGGILFF